MKHKLLLSTLTAIIVFAATTTADAGIFGRLSVVWNGCNPCEPVACQPCEPIACMPCEPICDPCVVVACDPCDPCGSFGYHKPFRPFGGFFANLFAAKHACGVGCDPCEPIGCLPCEPIACQPCEPVCDPCVVVACDPCDPCGSFGYKPFRPFGGFFANMFAPKYGGCCDVGCDPCEPVCEPCVSCRW
ncbi:MAG: hypothetical protein FWE95_01130 [Planctomycetaceae bacterium]|nr:hypothetical protein [Planctomycetaceae bacterium]